MTKEKLTAIAVAIAALGLSASCLPERAEAHGTYHAVLHECVPGNEAEYAGLVARINDLAPGELARLDQIRRVVREETFDNLVTTVGKNFALDSYLSGSGYTAAWFLGLISSVSYSTVAVGDTMASHAGWLEAGATNAPTFSGARKTAAWAAASAGSKALSAGLVFTFTGAGTVKGCFLTTGSVVDATTGTLYSAGLFSGGDQPVVATNTLTVTYTASL